MVGTYVNVSGRPGELPSANGAQRKSFLLSKVCFALSKVYLALSKVFWVLTKVFRLLPRVLSKALNQHDRATSLCGISWTPRGLTTSHHLGSPKPLRRGSALPRRVRPLPLSSLQRCGCGSLATLCGLMASTTRQQ